MGIVVLSNVTFKKTSEGESTKRPEVCLTKRTKVNGGVSHGMNERKAPRQHRSSTQFAHSKGTYAVRVHVHGVHDFHIQEHCGMVHLNAEWLESILVAEGNESCPRH